ncbi:hypothetical protein ACJIZ3_005464 [Penstemon smallii]|uniref:Ribosomal RNA processing protein 1 n=1 Tax=Penstemon smallii TaxID=265156 RepID=A0ABD3S4Y5_9LAMI
MKKRPREPKPLLPAIASASGPSLIKNLASCNTTVRSQSLRRLQSWLVSESNNLTESDIKKLWKGLFYCLWHSDKTPNQVNLIERLTSLFLSLKPSLSLEFFRGFLITLRREWPGIDRLRLDKFYLLIRRFVKAVFELMKLRKWDVEVLREYVGVLENNGFLAEDKLQGNGVNYHVASVFLEELKGVGFPVRKNVVDLILGPFFAVLLRSKDRILVAKVRSCVFYEMVKEGKQLLEKKKMGVDEDVLLLGVVSLRMELVRRFYEVGSAVECVQGNRKVALELHQEFLKLEKELQLSGIEVAIPEYSDVIEGGDEGDTEVPQLIPIEYNSSNNGNVDLGSQEVSEDTREDEGQLDGRNPKKSKKNKKGMDGDDKKAKKKKKKKKIKRKDESEISEINVVVKESDDLVTLNGMDSSLSLGSGDSEMDLSENVISNLHKQFEKVAAESGFSDIPLISEKHGKHAKKRKRTKNAGVVESGNVDSNGAKGVEKSGKKVRFSMKNNLVWMPQNPMPPESLRLPPTVTPRGSAMKKGVPPGPIRLVKKKVNKKKTLKSSIPVMKKRKKITRTI